MTANEQGQRRKLRPHLYHRRPNIIAFFQSKARNLCVISHSPLYSLGCKIDGKHHSTNLPTSSRPNRANNNKPSFKTSWRSFAGEAVALLRKFVRTITSQFSRRARTKAALIEETHIESSHYFTSEPGESNKPYFETSQRRSLS